MELRPHILKYQKTTEGHEDADGNYTPGLPEYVGEIPCRAVKNNRAAEVKFTDGEVYVYDYAVYVDLGLREFKANDSIQVFDGDGRKIIESKIHGEPYNKQLHVKFWV